MKKGFIFVETMVVIAFLGTVLLTVYSSFTTVLDNAKTRLAYDDTVYLYRTYYILSFLEENNFFNISLVHILLKISLVLVEEQLIR